MRRLLVTAFGPFGPYKKNPSELLAREVLGSKALVSPVSYAAVDEFTSCPPTGIDRVLMLGVGGKTDRLRVERIARNFVGGQKDVWGAIYGPDLIDPDQPDSVAGALFHGWNRSTMAWTPSRNAGSYLCNYLYFRIATMWPRILSGFVHVPPFSSLPLGTQADYLTRVLSKIEREAN